MVICRGKDALLFDEEEVAYIDAIASWWCNPHGHANPQIAHAVADQLLQLEHVLFGGFTHPKAIELSEKLLQHLPQNHKKIFYSDNGSTAVEVALKMALQYFANHGKKRTTFIAFENAFHGDTFAAMAVSGIGFFTEAFADLMIQVKRIPLPQDDNIEFVIEKLQSHLEEGDVAGFIFEPIVLGAAGMQIYNPKHLDQLIKICKKAGVLCIADEVMTGFGRTGTLFATDQLSQKPDMICLSKALTGGFIPLAVTSCTQEIYNAFLSEKVEKAFFHGHTFMANPAGCAAALASLQITLSQQSQDARRFIHQQQGAFAEKLSTNYKVRNVAVQGVILRFELETSSNEYYGSLRNQLYDFFIAHQIILRPVGNIIYVLPPYCITAEQLATVYQVIEKALQHFGFAISK